MADELYVGYRKRAPPATARFVRRVVVALGAFAVGMAALIASSQDTVDPGTFEYGVDRAFAGRVLEVPYPMLFVEPSGATPTLYLLVARGKHGAAGLVTGLEGRRVRLAGSLIERGRSHMIEIAPDSVEVDPAAPAVPELAPRTLGRLRMRGEIVDGKCFLGVMKPGRQKPHRDCAARCLAGGAPPLFWVPGREGGYAFLLVDERGDGLRVDLRDWVAEPVEIEGRVERLGDVLVLAADPATWRRAG